MRSMKISKAGYAFRYLLFGLMFFFLFFPIYWTVSPLAALQNCEIPALSAPGSMCWTYSGDT